MKTYADMIPATMAVMAITIVVLVMLLIAKISHENLMFWARCMDAHGTEIGGYCVKDEAILREVRK